MVEVVRGVDLLIAAVLELLEGFLKAGAPYSDHAIYAYNVYYVKLYLRLSEIRIQQ